jgi:hypothetical protein
MDRKGAAWVRREEAGGRLRSGKRETSERACSSSVKRAVAVKS